MGIEEERCKILQIDSRLEEILDTTSYFLDRSKKIMMGRIVWIETNEEPPAVLPVKDQHSLKQEYDLLEFAINVAEEFKKTVKKTKGACAEYCRRVLATYNRCQISVERRLDAIPEHKLFIENLQNKYQEDEQEIQQVKDLDEQILKNAVTHAAVSIHLLEDQLCLSPARIEGVRNQVAKYEINIRFLEPSGFEGIAAEAQAWKKFVNDQAGPSS